MRYGYLFLALIVLFISVITYNSSLKKEILTSQRELLKIENQSKKISDLRGKWKSKKANKDKLIALLNTPNVKQTTKTNKTFKNSLRVKLEGIDKNVFQTVSKKLFENPYEMKSFTFKREDKHKATFEFGVEF